MSSWDYPEGGLQFHFTIWQDMFLRCVKAGQRKILGRYLSENTGMAQSWMRCNSPRFSPALPHQGTVLM